METGKAVYLKFRAKVVRNGAEPLILRVRGREAWMLLQLIYAGKTGVTSVERPGPRMSHYIMKLRRAGFHIDTVDEQHAGSFAGRHGRYHLRDAVVIGGGTLDDYLASPEGQREFPDANFARAA
jgi:hypothetical protein